MRFELPVYNAPDFSDDNSVLYGHHMRNGSMFAGIEQYKKQEYFDAHPLMYLLTEDTIYEVELFAGIVKDNSGAVLNFGGEAEYDAHITQLLARSTFESGIVPKYGDKLLAMSTCVYDFEDARYVLVGRLIPHRFIME